MPEFLLIDYASLAWFALCWFGFTLFADYSPMRTSSVSTIMDEQRLRWMRNMVDRELRMIDTFIQGSLIGGVAFFASTSLLLVGGLLAALGATDQAVAVLRDLPLATQVSRGVWELKVLLLVVIFIYSFFKFAWCHRLFQYCSILLGAAPAHTDESDDGERYAQETAKMHALAAQHFIRGLRAYFFALAALSWFINSWLFILVTGWVTFVLYRREFRSRSHRILRALS